MRLERLPIAGCSITLADWVTPPAEAEIDAVCMLETTVVNALNPTLFAPFGTLTDAGTTTFALELVSETVVPLAGAAPERLTVHETLVPPATVEGLQCNEDKVTGALGGGAAGDRFSEKVRVTPLRVALMIAVVGVSTGSEAEAAKGALDVPAAMDTDPGTLIPEPAERLTVTPLAAFALR